MTSVTVKIGDKYRSLGRLWHVCGMVDDQVVVRYWSKRKQEWIYKCEPLWIFDPADGIWQKEP